MIYLNTKLADTIKNIKRRVNFDIKRAEGEHPFVNIWSEEEHRKDKSRSRARAVPYFIGNNAPTVLLCPGGAYAFISYINEGYDIARALNSFGYNVLILCYRTGVSARCPNSPDDVGAAIRYIKNNAKKYSLDGDNIILFGFSAGGHLCSYYTAKAAEEGKDCPRALLLGYPVISMEEETHKLSRHYFLGNDEDSPEKRRAASVDKIAGSGFPPTFIMHCEDDTTVPISNSVRLCDALSALGTECVFKKYPAGGHGIGLGKGTSAEGWINEAADFIKRITDNE